MKITKLIFAWVSLTSCTSALAASVLLREQATHQGSIVYLGDIADISAESTSEMDNLVTTPLMAAPAPATEEFLSQNEVRELLVSRGIEVDSLTLGGSAVVKIGKVREKAISTENSRITPVSTREIEAAVIAAIQQHLLEETGHALWSVEATLDAQDCRKLNSSVDNLTAWGGKNPWTGYQRFEIRSESSEQSVYVATRVEQLHRVVVAVRRVEAGDYLGAADVEVQERTGSLPQNVAVNLDQVIGKEALRHIEAETLVQTNQVRAPLQVQRGETVKVFARTGGISVSTYAVVKQDGSMGELVQVETLDSKERFAARVSGWKQLEVLPTGATAADVAASSNPQPVQLR